MFELERYGGVDVSLAAPLSQHMSLTRRSQNSLIDSVLLPRSLVTYSSSVLL
jgi:hypothetical protein